DDELTAALASIWGARDDRYSEERASLTPELRAARPRIEMSYIGG
ncbi:MAG: GTP 3',8-cyclase MoaA, partial [Microbacterium sp.]